MYALQIPIDKVKSGGVVEFPYDEFSRRIIGCAAVNWLSDGMDDLEAVLSDSML